MAKILIVDDDSDLLNFVSDCLGGEHDVALTTSGEEALSLAKAAPFDVVLTDIFMPMKDGFEVIKELNKSSPQTKIIAMTAHVKPEQISFLELAGHFGAVAGLSKPFTSEHLRKVINEVLALLPRAPD